MEPKGVEDGGAELLLHLERLHTTQLGEQRIAKNLSLVSQDVVGWCAEKIKAPHSRIQRRGKNWYITVDGCEFTVNASSYTIITAHTRPPQTVGGAG